MDRLSLRDGNRQEHRRCTCRTRDHLRGETKLWCRNGKACTRERIPSRNDRERRDCIVAGQQWEQSNCAWWPCGEHAIPVRIILELRTNLDLKGGPFRSSPVECLSGLNEMSEPTNDFLHWSRLIRTMCHNNIHIIQLKSFKRVIHSLNQMLSTQSNFIRRIPLNQSHGLREMTNPSPEQFG